MPTVTVLLPTFARNKSGHLARSIQSVIDQTYRDFELIVVDDCSTDGSRETIQDFAARDPRVKTLRFDINTGMPAFTTGVAASRSQGEFI
jgi:glycosyltransferase involved in cell wall biosynthesis